MSDLGTNIPISRAWPRFAVYIGIGMLFLGTVNNQVSSAEYSLLVERWQLGERELLTEQILALLRLLSFSFAIGLFCVVVGHRIQISLFKLSNGIEREDKLFRSKNSLLIDRYQRASFQAEVLGGTGILLLLTSLVVIIANRGDLPSSLLFLTTAISLGISYTLQLIAALPMKELDNWLDASAEKIEQEAS